MARSTIEVKHDVTPTFEFDDEAKLKAKAEEFKNEGNDAYSKKEFSNAIKLYTEGIQVNCTDVELKAKLYNNRSTAYFYLGNFRESLNDAEAAVNLQPTYIKAIARGARACVELHLYEEAITWCDKGLTINKINETFLDLRTMSVDRLNKLREKDGQDMKSQKSSDPLHKPAAENMGDRAEQEKLRPIIRKCYGSLAEFIKAIDYHLKIAKEKEDRDREGGDFCNLGMAYQALGDFKQAICYHTLDLKTAKDLGDRAAEGRACCHLGDAYEKLVDFKKAIYYYELDVNIAKGMKDRTAELRAYSHLGNVYGKLKDFNKAFDYHRLGLEIAKEIGDRGKIGIAYGNLGKAYSDLGNFEKAKQYQQLYLEMAKDLGDKDGERLAYLNLGSAFSGLRDFKQAIHYYKLCLEMTKEWRDRSKEFLLCFNLGALYHLLEDFRNALNYSELCLKISVEVGDKVRESFAYLNLGCHYQRLGDFKKAIYYSELAIKMEDTAAHAYCNLSLACRSLEDFKKAIECGKKAQEISKETGEKLMEGHAYHVLCGAYESFGDSKRAIICSKISLQIARELGDRAGEARAYSALATSYHSLKDLRKSMKYRLLSITIAQNLGCDRSARTIDYYYLGCTLESLGYLTLAAECYKSSIKALNEAIFLQRDDELKICMRDMYHNAHISLWQVLLKQNKIDEALSAAEQARAQALKDLMKVKYGYEVSTTPEETVCDMSIIRSSTTVYTAYDEKKIVFWVSQNGNASSLRSRIIKSGNDYHALQDMKDFWQSLVQTARDQNCVTAGVKCEDRSLDNLRDETATTETLSVARSHSSHLDPTEPNALKKLYDLIIGLVCDLLHNKEVIIVPDGPLCLVPYAALVDSNSKFLSESFRIRVIPSLTSLKLITDCPAGYHCKTGALLIGDPCLQEVTYQGRKLQQLPFAKKEVEMIGRILNIEPLTGTKATKDAVLQRISSVALIHIAAHGRMETGEIALAPNPKRKSQIPVKEDFLLTIADVLRARLRARLVVLSCCHSAVGKIKSEGVVGIARAFLGAGARSVLVSLWAIDDEATLEFMKNFYQHLFKGESAIEALNQAMNSMRESEKFSEVKYWAPFVLIGDDVTLEFEASNQLS